MGIMVESKTLVSRAPGPSVSTIAGTLLFGLIVRNEGECRSPLPASIEANEGAAIFRLVAAGQGVSIYPSCARQVAFAGLVVRDFEEEAPVVETFGIVRGGGYPPMMDSLVNALRDIIIAGGESVR
jgi:DNA-binding transcriptional LysR family regulator